MPGPVSYTHLDVYKRQALSFGEVSRRLQEDDPGGAAVPDLQQSFLEMEEALP